MIAYSNSIEQRSNKRFDFELLVEIIVLTTNVLYKISVHTDDVRTPLASKPPILTKFTPNVYFGSTYGGEK